MLGIYSCITARITVPINCRYDCSSITKAIIDLQLEISASAQRCGITYSGRCLADPDVALLWVDRVDWPLQALRMPRNSPPRRFVECAVAHGIDNPGRRGPLVTIERFSVCRDSKAFRRLERFQM